MRATAERLAALAAGCAATARGLDAIGVRGWSGAAASAFRERHAELSARWARAAAAFRSAAQAWERFGIELVAAQELAAAAVARFSAAGGPLAAEADLDEARRMLAEARARRDRAADAAAREIAAAAALAPNPPGDGERRALAAADWVRANGVALGHVARGVGEGVEDLVRFARLVNPADTYNLNHPGRFLANASTALAGAVDDVVHPLRQVAGFVGPGWGSDPARAYGHLLPTALLMAVTGAGRAVGRAPGPRPGPAALGAAAPGRMAPLWADPRPTARPFTPAPPPPPPYPVRHHRPRLFPLRLGLPPIRLLRPHLRPTHLRPLRPLTLRRLLHLPPRRPHQRRVRRRAGWPTRPRPRRRLGRRRLARRRLGRARRGRWRRRTGPRPAGWRRSRGACRRIRRS